MFRHFKYRLYPNASQLLALEGLMEVHRRIYNEYLGWRILAWDCWKVNVSMYDFNRWLVRKRKRDTYFTNLLSKTNAVSLQQTVRRVDAAYQHFFRTAKSSGKKKWQHPRFKPDTKRMSVTFYHGNGKNRPNGIKLHVEKNRLYLQHIGMIKIKLHRPLGGKFKIVTVIKEVDQWYVTFACEMPDPIPCPQDRPAVGVDMGLAKYLTTSDGHSFENPRFEISQMKVIRRISRAIDRKRKGSCNQKKAVVPLRKLWRKIKNRRHEFQFQLANWLVNRYSAVVVEDLNILGMIKNDKISQAIGDASWGKFIRILKGIAEKNGVSFVSVSPINTSKKCHACGELVEKTLDERIHKCGNCGIKMDRDENAAINILAKADLARAEPVGVKQDVSPVCPENVFDVRDEYRM